MMTHGGNRETKLTTCGKPLGRHRWWVPDAPYVVHGFYGDMATFKTVDQRHEINCLACRRALKEEVMSNPQLSTVIAELHEARAALQRQGINARFDLEITDKGPRVSANVGSPIFEITKGLLPAGLKYVTVKIRPTSDHQPRIK